MNIPRSEHPKPQFERNNWLNLNGEWDFEFDFGNSKFESGILEKDNWDRNRQVQSFRSFVIHFFLFGILCTHYPILQTMPQV